MSSHGGDRSRIKIARHEIHHNRGGCAQLLGELENAGIACRKRSNRGPEEQEQRPVEWPHDERHAEWFAVNNALMAGLRQELGNERLHGLHPALELTLLKLGL